MSLECPKCGSGLVGMTPAGDCWCMVCRHTWRVGPGALEMRLREIAIRRAGGVSALHTMARAWCVSHTDAARAEAEAREEPATPMTEQGA